MLAVDKKNIRAVTNLMVTEKDIDTAIIITGDTIRQLSYG